jgi:hypothetical protein
LELTVALGVPAYGVYAYPWYGYGYGWDPGLSYYALPVTNVSASQGLANVELGRFIQIRFGPPVERRRLESTDRDKRGPYFTL